MAEKAEDLNLPVSVVTRLIKEVLPPGVTISKEARIAITRCASVFVLYATATANTHAVKAKRKTLMAVDIYDALTDMEYEEFVESIKETVDVWRKNTKLHKKLKPGNAEDQTQDFSESANGSAEVLGLTINLDADEDDADPECVIVREVVEKHAPLS